MGGLEQQVSGIKHVTVKSVEHERRLTALQTKVKEQEVLLQKALKRLEDQSKVLERLVTRACVDREDQKSSDQEGKSNKA